MEYRIKVTGTGVIFSAKLKDCIYSYTSAAYASGMAREIGEAPAWLDFISKYPHKHKFTFEFFVNVEEQYLDAYLECLDALLNDTYKNKAVDSSDLSAIDECVNATLYAPSVGFC